MSKLKKVSPKRAFACLLVLFALLTVFTAMAENAAQTEAPVATEEATTEEATDETTEEVGLLFVSIVHMYPPPVTWTYYNISVLLFTAILHAIPASVRSFRRIFLRVQVHRRMSGRCTPFSPDIFCAARKRRL